MTHVIGVDIGGTFTDCIVIDDDGRLTIGKVPSTPPTFFQGFLDAIEAAARARGIGAAELVGSAAGIYHGSTIAINALVERRVATCGLLTTRGHRDTLASMQAGKRLQGMPAEVIARVSQQFKPEPLVPKQRIAEVDERVAFDANVIVALNEQTAAEAIDSLLEQGVEAIAVSLLWSVRNPAHEHRLREMIAERAPDLFVSLSSDVVARTGEYERTVATVINSVVGPLMGDYLTRLEDELQGLGYRGRLQVMTCSGGLIDAEQARALPVLTLGSGPVAGLVGSAMLGRHLSSSANGSGPRASNVITTDMGGTTFDVGIVRDGAPVVRTLSFFEEFAYSISSIDIRALGSGGGSIVRLDENTGTLRVGPQSAGARPGPACYGRGGELATVTDADLVLGYFAPERFAGGNLPLDLDAARRALAAAGRPLGMEPEEAAAAAVRIVDNQMADAIRLATIQQGIDPRGFEIYAYGGAGPLHAAGYAAELGIKRVLVPFSDLASGWSAVGVALADALVVREQALPMQEPFDADALQEAWQALEQQVVDRLVQGGIPAERVSLERIADMRYTTQVNELQVHVAPGAGEELVRAMKETFDREYTRLYGEGSAYPDAGYAIAGVTVRGRARISDYELAERGEQATAAPEPMDERPVIWYHRDSLDPVPTPVFDGMSLLRGSSVTGHAIIELPDTTVLIREGQTASVDALGNLVVDL